MSEILNELIQWLTDVWNGLFEPEKTTLPPKKREEEPIEEVIKKAEEPKPILPEEPIPVKHEEPIPKEDKLPTTKTKPISPPPFEPKPTPPPAPTSTYLEACVANCKAEQKAREKWLSEHRIGRYTGTCLADPTGETCISEEEFRKGRDEAFNRAIACKDECWRKYREAGA